jgi:hypothetical protein
LRKAPGGYTHLLVAIDKFSKWVEVRPITNLRAEQAVTFFTDIFYRFGVPNSINTDNGVSVLDRQTYQGGTRGSRLCGEDHDRETENSKVCARTHDTRFIQVQAAKVACPTSCLGDQVWRPALGVGQVPG